MFRRRFGPGGPLRLVLGWLLRALGLGFVLGAAVGVRAGRHDGRPDAHVMADRVERAMRVLAGHDPDEGPEPGPSPEPSPGPEAAR